MISKISENKFLVDFESAKRWMVAAMFTIGTLKQFWLFPGDYSVVVTFSCDSDGAYTVSDFCSLKDSDRWFGFIDSRDQCTMGGYTGGNKLGGYVGVSRGDDGYHFGTPKKLSQYSCHSESLVVALEKAMKVEHTGEFARLSVEEFESLVTLAESAPAPEPDTNW